MRSLMRRLILSGFSPCTLRISYLVPEVTWQPQRMGSETIYGIYVRNELRIVIYRPTLLAPGYKRSYYIRMYAFPPFFVISLIQWESIEMMWTQTVY